MSWSDKLTDNLTFSNKVVTIEFNYKHPFFENRTVTRSEYSNGYISWSITNSWFDSEQQKKLEEWYQTTYLREKKIERVINEE
jgi:hypothetical protein